ncbi:hypothetical protein [Natronolimnobius baerhuensis]|uniref:HIT-type domain-containing protein n=1 Tax=Natronolimnobius baerhuensis TaxID=253108 RepID=A0A202E8B2_9EURY|nr:hypothetical protein [Natronolimnobius baerhuensis]OVE84378.1 hypothetical protein B2G88_08160 [Natronolimnobius baerhuensis]
MSVSGLCQICESRPAEERCENCGTLACEQHYERAMGLCADCATQAQPGMGDSESEPNVDTSHDDVDVNRF